MSKIERERKKQEQEKMQAILNQLLREEDNKYCADCDAKGPRWASWNLGVFLCIRCAGIHRNLGVHVSKVRSVNLDSWTPEQVAYMQHIGNSVARSAYEAHLPDNFRRPQSDSSVQAFIQAKYDQKRYVMKDWQPPKIDSRKWPSVDDPIVTGSGDKRKAAAPKSRAAAIPAPISSLQPPPGSNTVPEPVKHRASSPSGSKAPPNANRASALADLVDLAPPVPQQPPPHVASAPNLAGQNSAIGTNDLLGLMSPPAQQQVSSNTAFPATTGGGGGDLNGLVLSGPPALATQPAVQPIPQSGAAVPPSSAAADDLNLLATGTAGQDSSGKKSATDILALYSSGASQGPVASLPQVAGGMIPAALPPQGNPQSMMAPVVSPGQPPGGMGMYPNIPCSMPQQGHPGGGYNPGVSIPSSSVGYGGMGQHMNGGMPPTYAAPMSGFGQMNLMGGPAGMPGGYGGPYNQQGYNMPPGGGYGPQQQPASAYGMGAMTGQFAGMGLPSAGQPQAGNPGNAGMTNTLATNLWR